MLKINYFKVLVSGLILAFALVAYLLLNTGSNQIWSTRYVPNTGHDCSIQDIHKAEFFKSDFSHFNLICNLGHDSNLINIVSPINT